MICVLMPYRTKLSLSAPSVHHLRMLQECTYASMRPAGPAPTTRTSLKKAPYPDNDPFVALVALVALKLPVSALWEVEGIDSVVRPGAILTAFGWSGGLLVVLDDGERFMKGHIDGDML